MLDTLPEHHQQVIQQLARRLNSYTGSIILKNQGESVFCVVAANDVHLLRQAFHGPMNRSSRRKLRERLFERPSIVDLDDELTELLLERHPADEERPFLHFFFERAGGSKYAVLRITNLAYMEYLLYVSQRAFRENLYRRL
jgi:hypothetical protein